MYFNGNDLTLPIALVVIGFVALFKLCDREHAAQKRAAAHPENDPPTKWNFVDIVLLIVSVGSMVGGVIWGLNLLGYQPNPYFPG